MTAGPPWRKGAGAGRLGDPRTDLLAGPVAASCSTVMDARKIRAHGPLRA
ncbi:hypothetical protein [Streptomyces violaceusniger]